MTEIDTFTAMCVSAIGAILGAHLMPSAQRIWQRQAAPVLARARRRR
jgi:hypothetical protein